jgi:hypothetical protein
VHGSEMPAPQGIIFVRMSPRVTPLVPHPQPTSEIMHVVRAMRALTNAGLGRGTGTVPLGSIFVSFRGCGLRLDLKPARHVAKRRPFVLEL